MNGKGFRRLNQFPAIHTSPCFVFILSCAHMVALMWFLKINVFPNFHTSSPFLSIWRHLCVLTVNLLCEPPAPSMAKADVCLLHPLTITPKPHQPPLFLWISPICFLLFPFHTFLLSLQTSLSVWPVTMWLTAVSHLYLGPHSQNTLRLKLAPR